MIALERNTDQIIPLTLYGVLNYTYARLVGRVEHFILRYKMSENATKCYLTVPTACVEKGMHRMRHVSKAACVE